MGVQLVVDCHAHRARQQLTYWGSTPFCCGKYSEWDTHSAWTQEHINWSTSMVCWHNSSEENLNKTFRTLFFFLFFQRLSRASAGNEHLMGLGSVMLSPQSCTSSIWTVNWIRQWGLAKHQLTIGAPRRPMMSGRGLRLWRSMMQGQVNVNGAKQTARRMMM